MLPQLPLAQRSGLALLLLAAPLFGAPRVLSQDQVPSAATPVRGTDRFLELLRSDAGTHALLDCLLEQGPALAREAAELARAGRAPLLGPEEALRLRRELAAILRLLAERAEPARAGEVADWTRLVGTGLALVGEPPTAEELDLCVLLATPHPAADAVRVGPVLEAFERDLSAALTLGQELPAWVERRFGELPRELRTPVLRAIARTPRLGSLRALPMLLQVDSELDGHVLLALAKVARDVHAPLDDGRLLRVRMQLARPEPFVRQAAAQALGRLEDYEGVQDLMALLEDPDPGVALASHDALRRITAMELDPLPRLWVSWYEEESRWWSERGPDVLEQLRGAGKEQLPELLRELGAKRLFRRELEGLLLPLLLDPDPRVVEQTLAALSSLRATGTLPVMVDLLEHPSPAVRERALRTLRHLTGRDLPGDAEVWRGLEL